MVIENDSFRILKKNSALKETDIKITIDNTDIRVLEISQEDSSFNFYNEIIVYGYNVKGIKRNSSSIKQIGRKTLEEFDETLSTQAEVDRRARELLDIHTRSTKRFTIKLFDKGLEWLRAGDIITVDYQDEHIPFGQYKVLQIKHNPNGYMELEVGSSTKGLENRLAELLVNNKKTTAKLRGNKFKSSAVDENHYDTMKIKEVKLVIRQITAPGANVFGFDSTFGTSTLFGFGTSSTTNVLLERDLT